MLVLEVVVEASGVEAAAFEETGVRETVGPLARDLLRLDDELTVDNCSCISIMWSPRRIVKFRGALPLRKSTTCNKTKKKLLLSMTFRGANCRLER